MEQGRKLKVYKKYTRKSKSFMPNPEIRLTGKWIENLGFKCGNSITVRSIENGLILISEGAKSPPVISL